MSSEKTEEPTQKKLSDARKQGQVAISRDIVSAATLGVSFAVLFTCIATITNDITELLNNSLRVLNEDPRSAVTFMSVETALVIARISFLAICLVAATGVAATYFQIGFILSFESIRPDLKRLDPFDRIKQTFSSKSFVELLRNIVKTVFLGILVWLVLKSMLKPLISATLMGPLAMLAVLRETLLVLATNIMIGYIIVAAFDVVYQRWQHLRSLRMTKDEVKQEYKESEGSPEIKNRRRQLHEELVLQDDGEAVQKSNVVVTNPVHIAVAIRAGSDTAPPTVMTIGRGLKAKHIRDLAADKDVPVIENVELARDLFRHCRSGDPVPDRLIGVVAEIITWAQELRKSQASQGRSAA